MTYILPVSPSIALLTKSVSRWETEDILGKWYLWIVWFVLSVSALIPIALFFVILEWPPNVPGLPRIHIVIPLILLFVGAIVSLYTFFTNRHFLQIVRIFCFTSCFVLGITMDSSARSLVAFRSTKDMVQNYLLDKKNYMLLSWGKTKPSLVFYSGKNVLELETDSRLEKLISAQECSLYIMMSKNAYQKKQTWIQKKKFHAVRQDGAHVLLEKE